MKITCVSDLHGYYPPLPGGDLLIVAGDLTSNDNIFDFGHFVGWINSQNYVKKVFVAGNHDNRLQKKGFEKVRDIYSNIGVDYLCDSGTEFEGVKIWGSPYTKTFKGMNPSCKAFTCKTEEELHEKYCLIPKDTDILMAHGPPYGILDLSWDKKRCGSKAFFAWLKWVERPRLLVCGHIHEGYGIDQESFPTYNGQMMKIVNASHVNENYEPINPPITFEMDFPARDL